jgi:prevent-host-death family protein
MTSTRSIGAGEARTHFYGLLDDVARGGTVIVTKRGTPVARLVAIDDAMPGADVVLERMRAFRKGNNLNGLSIRELIDEGRH